MEGENITTSKNSRNNRKKRSRRSSILKINMSPVRTALGDLDPNHVNETTREAKAKRLSKRVSFADTMSVREFLNDKDAHTLGLLNSPCNNQGKQTSSEICDEEVGHTIQGLDSLLSAPIKTQPEQTTTPDEIMLQENPPTELTMTMDFTQTHGAILTEMETNQTRQRFRSTSSDSSDGSMQHEIDIPNPTFVGPTYSCLMPASFNSSTATEPSDIVQRADAMDQTRVFGSDDTTGFMELTTCYGGSMDSSTTEQKSQKTNAGDFLRSLMTSKPAINDPQSEGLSELASAVDSYHNNSNNAKVSFGCSDPVSQLIKCRTDLEVMSNTGIDKENKAHSQLFAAKRSDLELEVEVTKVFCDEDQADMDITECVPCDASVQKLKNNLLEDQTQLFTTDNAELMDMTECIGNVKETLCKDLKPRDTVSNQTVMFDGDTDMDETAPLGQIQLPNHSVQGNKVLFQNKSLSIIQEADDENMSRQSVNYSTMDVDGKNDINGTRVAPVHDFTLGVDFTANVGQGIRPKYTSTPFQPSVQNSFYPSVQNSFCPKLPDPVTVSDKESNCVSGREMCVSKSEKQTEKMNFTDYVAGLPRQQSANLDKSNKSTVENTQVFGIGEDTGGMELTSCIGGIRQTFQGNVKTTDRASFGELLPTLKTASVKGRASLSETTTVFGAGENTGRMELTSCVGGLLPSLEKTPLIKGRTSVSETTTVFGAGENTGRMELTSCVGGLLSSQGKTPVVKDRASLSETTTVFGGGENTGRMELTSCVGGLLSSQGKIPMIKGRTSLSETTTVFGGGENTGHMELTSCVGGLLSSQEKTPMIKGRTSLNETTTVFGAGENTGRMELTSCVGGLLSNQGKTPMVKGRTSLSETTTVFGAGENTGRMELTSCVGGLLSSQGKIPMIKGRTSLSETTTVFGGGENTGRMELTSCVGGLLSSQGKIPMIKGRTSLSETTTVFGGGENTGRMELTSCVGGLLSSQGKTPMIKGRTSLNETTTVFGAEENTGRMELTSCVGGLLSNQGKTPMVKGRTSLSETTTVFGAGENTGRMELTSCVGELAPNIQEKMPVQNMEVVTDSTGEKTERMEFTSCVGGIVPDETAEPYPGETTFNLGNSGKMELPSCVESASILTDYEMNGSVITDKMEITSTGQNQKSIMEEKKKEQNQQLVKNVETTDVERLKRCDIESPRVQTSQDTDIEIKNQKIKASYESTPKSSLCPDRMAESDEEVGFPKMSLAEKEILDTNDCSASGTFTIKVENGDTFTIPSNSNTDDSQEMADSLEEVQRSKRKQEVCFESKSKFIKTDLGDSFKGNENDGMKGILEELPPDEIEELENLELTATTNFLDIDVGTQLNSQADVSQKSNISKLERTENFSFLNMTKSAGNEITVGEVLENFFANLTSLPSVNNIRRSVMPVIEGSEPNTLINRLRTSCVDAPKCKMYDWAVEYVRQNTNTMEKSVQELTEKLFNKEEMNHIMIVGSEELRDFEKRIQKLHQVCKKMMKSSWKEWKSKVLSSIHTSVNERYEHLKKSVESVSESCIQIDSDIQQLDKYEADLDAAISELESIELPRAELQDIYSFQQTKLVQLEADLKESQNNLAILEEKKDQMVVEEQKLKGEMQDLEGKNNRRDDLDEAAESREEAYKKYKRIESICEGRIKEWSGTGCSIAFLYGSLHLRIAYGNASSNESKEKLLSSMKFESYLESNSADSAHLSHVMLREAVDCQGLLHKYPTTNGLPKMLDEVSYIASHARCLESDIRHVQFFHEVHIEDKKVKVEFSNFRAFAKFYVTFDLVPGSYPSTPVKFHFKNKIGDVSEEDIRSVLSSVQPCYSYFKKLVEAVDDFVNKRCKDDSDDGDFQ